MLPNKLRSAVAALASAAVVAGVTAQYARAGQAAPAEKPELDAKFIKMAPLPKKLLTGQLFKVAITMKNTGTRN